MLRFGASINSLLVVIIGTELVGMMLKAITFVLVSISSYSVQEHRIVNGMDISIKGAPFQVSLQDDESHLHFCAGSILSRRWILTAAHCVNRRHYHVVVGMTKKSEGGIVHTIRRAIRHPHYGSEYGKHKFCNDAALLELNEPIVFNERAQPVQLPTDDQRPPVGKEAMIQGWGLLSASGETPDDLQGTTLPIWPPKDCAMAYRRKEHARYFLEPDPMFICAGWMGSKPDTCSGDSGAPLTYDGVQYGIVSFGMGCANPRYPKVFTNVYNMRDFIYHYIEM